MDITYFLGNSAQDKEDSKNEGLPKYPKLLATKISGKKDKVNLLELTYLIQFIKTNGSLANISWFVDIINKINDDEISKLCASSFNKMLEYNIELSFNSDKVTNNFTESKMETMELTDDQKKAVGKMVEFMSDKNQKTFALYGLPGTGKSTVIVELLSFLLAEGYLKSVVFTAPTNKAVNIMKSKIRSNIKILAEKVIKTEYKNDSFNLEETLEDLGDHGIKIEFMTIHRLLNYKNEYDNDGSRIFTKGGKTCISKYEVVIIDECSMIPLQIVTHLFEDIRYTNQNIGENYKRCPKLLFSGDPAQLPSVSEKISAIFIKTPEQLSYDFFANTMLTVEQNTKFEYVRKFQAEGSVKRHQDLINDILRMQTITMREVVRNKIGNVVNLCYNIREWVENIRKLPEISAYKGKGVFLYQFNKTKKTETDWFKKFITMQKNNIDNHISNIILTWTNKQTNEYNITIRKVMFGNEKTLDKYEIGDILMLNDFYNFDETIVKGKDMKNRFYTSEQIKVVDKDILDKPCTEFIEQITKTMFNIKCSDTIIANYKKLIKSLNTKTNRQYKVWKLSVQRMAEVMIKNIIPEVYIIYVIHDDSNEILENDKLASFNLIKKFRKTLTEQCSDQISRVDKEIVRPLWKQWNKIFIDPYAKVNYGNSHSVHKSQGSSFYNVFVDCDDILNNKDMDEAKRCVYTALTRSSNEIHLLI